MKSILMKLFVVGLCVSFFPIQAIAGGFTGFHQIEWLYQRQCTASRGLEIRLVTEHANPDGCSNDYVLEVRCNSEAYQSAVAMSLTAFAGNYYVRAFVNRCDRDGHAIVRALQMQRTFTPEQP